MSADTARTMDQAVAAMVDRGGKYLTFKLDAEEYGLQILKVQEIIKMLDITKVPQTPGFVRGVINLRGKVIPVLDLRLKFDMEPRQTTDRTCIIVLEVAREDEAVTMGVVVDQVSEVVDIAGKEIEQTPVFGGDADTRFILGMAKNKGSIKILLDIDKVLSRDDIAKIGAVEVAA